MRRHFDRQADCYDEYARVQKRVAADLAARLPECAPTRILEIGCGTGGFTERLADAYPDAAITAVDFAPAMLAIAQRRLGTRVEFAEADAESYSPPVPVDLVVSNATFQWLGDVPGTLARLRGALRPGGRLLFSAFGDGTFTELRTAFTRAEAELGLPQRPHGPSLKRARWWRRVVAVHFAAVTVEEANVQERFASAAAFLHDLQRTGATHAGTGDAVWARPGLLRRMIARYEADFGDEQGIPATYHVLYVGASPRRRVQWSHA